ncbi:class I SAM-dependent methyltransferase [Streptomyces coelicoflavus]|uniref:class I SAM-dependent methyltransferase n=1 Tax=Streptomyces coelicoflavus TaxID=285562 RepID=UPI0036BCAE51
MKLYDLIAEQYDAVRPSYPDEVIDEILGTDGDALSVLDVGSGTGISGRQMRDRGAHVLGVDMSAGMSAVADRHGIETEVTPFDDWDPRGRTFDRVVSAQAWHWMDPVSSAQRAEPLLRPGGRLCLFWNLGYHPDDLADALAHTYERALPADSPHMTIGYAVNRSTALPKDFSVVTGAPQAFHQMTEEPFRTFSWEKEYTRDQWLDELGVHTDHLSLPTDARERLFEQIAETVDDFGGKFSMRFHTYLVCATVRR